jgi:hypothetical protein
MNFRVLPIFYVISAFLSGCSQFTTKIGVLPAEVDTLPETHYSRVLEIYGPPSQIHSTENGLYFLYENVALTENQFGFSLGFISLNLFSAVFGTADAHLQSLLIAFDIEGNQTNLIRNSWQEDVGKGSGLQFLFTPVPLVDDSSLRVSAPQNQWGMVLLMDQDDERIRIFKERLVMLGSPIIPVPNRP